MNRLQHPAFLRTLGIFLAIVVALGTLVEPVWSIQPQPDTVYITRTGIRYHRDGCRSLRRSRIPVSLQEAIRRGYTPCRICRPPGMLSSWIERDVRLPDNTQRQNFPTPCVNSVKFYVHSTAHICNAD